MQTDNSHPESQESGLGEPARLGHRRDTQSMHVGAGKPGKFQQSHGGRQPQKHVPFISGLIAAFSVWSA